ncbi:MAG: ATP-binding protein [Deltaproteobacteria bacterium]|nr:ATP-binding protein [Myxococcales bacterium]MDP3216548.1 ATP-binding protein [Deltaproteobacteria bacterium]
MHTLHNFKGFEEVGVDLFRPLTLIIGPNGIGKSNLIEGVELLAYLASGQPLHAVTDLGRGGAFEVRGGLQSCARRPGDEFSLGFLATRSVGGSPVSMGYFVTVRTHPHAEVWAEQLTVGGREWFSAESAGAGLLRVRYDSFASQGDTPTVTMPAGRTTLSQYRSIATTNERLEDCLPIVEALQHHLRRSYVFDPNSRQMRDYGRIGNNVLLRDGSNLSPVLHALSVGSDEEQATLRRIADRVRQLPEEPFGDIAFETTRLGDVLFGFTTSDGEPMVDARLLSDGTLRTLAVLTALETCEPGSRVVVEEFDNGLHPSRVAMMLAAIIEAATRRELNVLATTHSPTALDSLGPDQLANVQVCHWDAVRHAAKLTPLTELPRVDELLERGRLGDLVTRRVLESYLLPVTDAEREEQAEKWLAALP